jgi:hypothetical protein
MWMSGAVGSNPSLMRSGTPVAEDLASLASQSASGNSSSQPRFETAMACRTASVTGYFDGGVSEGKGSDMEGF